MPCWASGQRPSVRSRDPDAWRPDERRRVGAGVAPRDAARQRGGRGSRRKDAFNSLAPTGDAAALDRVLDPEFPKLVRAIYGIAAPPAPRTDLVTIFLTGIPGLNQPANATPSEQLRLNVAVPHNPNPHPLGVLGGDAQGFPNGRRLADDATDVIVRAAMGARRSHPRSMWRRTTVWATASTGTTARSGRRFRMSRPPIPGLNVVAPTPEP